MADRALCLAVRAAYNNLPLVDPDLRWSAAAQEVSTAIRSILTSEIMIFLPFLLWGGLVLWELNGQAEEEKEAAAEASS